MMNMLQIVVFKQVSPHIPTNTFVCTALFVPQPVGGI